MQTLRRQIAELENDLNEHDLVTSTLKPMEESRKAYRLVGSVLVERTVGEVLPAVVEGQKNIQMALDMYKKDLGQREQAAGEWKIKYGIKTQDEIARTQQRAQQAGGGGQQGVLS